MLCAIVVVVALVVGLLVGLAGGVVFVGAARDRSG